MALTRQAPPVEQTSESLLSRTMIAMYLASAGLKKQNLPPFEALHPAERSRYERMAIAALTVAYMEPVIV